MVQKAKRMMDIKAVVLTNLMLQDLVQTYSFLLSRVKTFIIHVYTKRLS